MPESKQEAGQKSEAGEKLASSGDCHLYTPRMKNFKKPQFSALFVFTALLVVITFMFTACQDPNGGETSHTHTWGAWADSAAATCTEPTKETRICSEDATHTETRNKEGSTALGHIFQWTAAAVWGMETLAVGVVCNNCTETNPESRMRLTSDMMAQIPAGSFIRSGYTITLSAFSMGKYQVTQEQYEAVMGVNPSQFINNPDGEEIQERRPVEMVTWFDAIEFCIKLSEMAGLDPVYDMTVTTRHANGYITAAIVEVDWTKNGYRLPTEAEWEYACRANANPATTYYWGNEEDEITVGENAWYRENSNSKTHEVGKKLPNTWGLYDMIGNVWEWCWDLYGDYPGENQTNPTGAPSGYARIQRGNSWDAYIVDMWSASRSINQPLFLFNSLGFRVARL